MFINVVYFSDQGPAMSNIRSRETPSALGKQATTTPRTPLSSGLENLLRTRSQADIVVDVQGKKIPGHKAVLMASSPYFEAMFNSGMREALSGEINFKEMDASTFELVLEFIYLNKDIVSAENGCALLEAASMLQIQLLFEKCEATLSCNISLKICLVLWRFASIHSSKTLRESAFVMILGQFQEFVKLEGFRSLDASELLEIIQDDRLVVTSEDSVVKAVIAWGNHSSENKTVVGRVFANLRLCQLSSEYLFAMKKYFTTTISSNVAQKAVDKAFEINFVPAQRQATSSILAKHRNCDTMEDVLLLVAGTKDVPTRTNVLEVLAYSFVKMQWFQLASLPRPCGQTYSWCSDGGNIFITGGSRYQENGFLESSGFSNKWKVGATLGEGRYSHAMIAMSDALYALGGYLGNRADAKTISSIERYMFRNKTWEKCGHLYQPVLCPSTSVSDNKVFLFGGVTVLSNDTTAPYLKFRRTTIIQCFDTTTNDTTVYTNSECVCRAMSTVQVDCRTYITEFDGKIGKFELKSGELKRKSGMLRAISRNPNERYTLVQKDGKVIVTYSISKDGDHLKQMLIINPETGGECMPPVLYPYPRTVGCCAKLTVQKKYLTKKQ